LTKRKPGGFPPGFGFVVESVPLIRRGAPGVGGTSASAC